MPYTAVLKFFIQKRDIVKMCGYFTLQFLFTHCCSLVKVLLELFCTRSAALKFKETMLFTLLSNRKAFNCFVQSSIALL